MPIEFYFAFGLIGFMMLAMAVGVIFTGRTLKGSCGGVGGLCPCDEAGTPNACKVDLEDQPETHPSSLTQVSETEDGVVLYGSTPTR